MKNIIISIISFFDRNFNLIFNSEKCVNIKFDISYFEYNDVITCTALSKNHEFKHLRCLGKNWFKSTKINKK